MYLKFENILDKIIEESKIQKHPEKIADFLECVMDELCDLSKEVYEKMTIKFAKMMCEYGFTIKARKAHSFRGGMDSASISAT